MQLNQADPAVRYGALLVLVLAFCGAGLVAVHGYWVSVNYQPPPLVVAVVAGAMTTAAHILGVQTGVANQQQAIDQGAKVARNGTQGNATGHPAEAQH